MEDGKLHLISLFSFCPDMLYSSHETGKYRAGMTSCKGCSAMPENSRGFYRAASISGSIMGNEHIDSLYYCEACECFTLESYVDYFGGAETESLQGPIPKEKGEALLALMRECKTPDEKRCRCRAHREYFGGGLD